MLSTTLGTGRPCLVCEMRLLLLLLFRCGMDGRQKHLLGGYVQLFLWLCHVGGIVRFHAFVCTFVPTGHTIIDKCGTQAHISHGGYPLFFVDSKSYFPLHPSQASIGLQRRGGFTLSFHFAPSTCIVPYMVGLDQHPIQAK